MSGLRGARAQTQGVQYAREAFHQLSYTLAPIYFI